MTYQQTIDRDHRRFSLADKDKSGQLDKEEFADFLHPRESNMAAGSLVEFMRCGRLVDPCRL